MQHMFELINLLQYAWDYQDMQLFRFRFRFPWPIMY